MSTQKAFSGTSLDYAHIHGASSESSLEKSLWENYPMTPHLWTDGDCWLCHGSKWNIANHKRTFENEKFFNFFYSLEFYTCIKYIVVISIPYSFLKLPQVAPKYTSLPNLYPLFQIAHWVQFVLSICAWMCGHTVRCGLPTSDHPPQRKVILLPPAAVICQ